MDGSDIISLYKPIINFEAVGSFFLVFAVGYSSFSQAKAKKVVYIIVDGVPADVIEKANLPNLHAIAKEGGYARAMVGGEKGTYSQTPTISAPGYNDLLTGTWGNKHNVWDNDGIKENYNYKTIFRYLKDADASKKIAIFSTWQDNRTILCGDGHLKYLYTFNGDPIESPKNPCPFGKLMRKVKDGSHY